jgi:hypothetical protein
MFHSTSASRSSRESHRLQVIYPERRRRRRYLTLKNAGIASIVMVVAVLLLSVWSAFRPHSSSNLFTSGVQSSDSTAVRHEPMTVSEGSIYDHPGTDSSLLDEDAQAKLRAPLPEPSSTAAAEPTTFEQPASQLGKGQRITISGGSEGVQVHTEPLPAPAHAVQAPPPPRR